MTAKMHPKKMTIVMKHAPPHKTKKNKIDLKDNLQDK